MASEHPTYVWWKGEQIRWEDATIHVTDLAWSTVGAVFEGIRGYWNEEEETLHVFRLKDHLERLVTSSRLVRLKLPYTVPELTKFCTDLIAANEIREDSYLRPLVYSDGKGRKLSDTSMESSLLINTHPMPSHLGTGLQYKAKVSSWTRISDNVMPPRVKNISNYRNGQLATSEALLDGYDTALLLNPAGKISEAPGACVAMIKGNKFITPDVTSGILESITRDSLIVLAREELGLEIVERAVDRTELYLADEVFTLGTAAEITPVVSIDHYDIGTGQIGATTRELDRLYEAVLRGTEKKYASWRTPVVAAKVLA
ncbi:MAG: branched-chain amino acid transaminase [Thermomicrobiales bacterium]